jgi:hypothetical protein
MSTTDTRGVEEPTHHLSHDWDSETRVSERVVAAIAEHEGESRGSLPAFEEASIRRHWTRCSNRAPTEPPDSGV